MKNTTLFLCAIVSAFVASVQLRAGLIVNVQESSTPGQFVWTKPSGTPTNYIVRRYLSGGGGGGASGASDSTVGVSVPGGGGGSPGNFVVDDTPISLLPATVTNTVGSFGSGGNDGGGGGSPGGAGGETKSVTGNPDLDLTVLGGAGGVVGGSADGSQASVFGVPVELHGGSASNVSVVILKYCGSPGAAGGSLSGADVTNPGFSVVYPAITKGGLPVVYLTGGAAGTTGNGGSVVTPSAMLRALYSTGGAGGGSSLYGQGGRGGAGQPGSGGGGGGAAREDGLGGQGNRGGAGFVRFEVIEP